MPRLTIAIPTLNRAYCLPKAINSALGQVDADIEIIVSNNGSKDQTREVLDRYHDPRIRIFDRDATIPACEHGNFLLDQARGEFFLGLSDDDFIEPDFAARVLAAFDQHHDVSFVYTGCWIHYGDVPVPGKTGPAMETGADFVAAFLGGKRDLCWCSCVSRVDDLRRIGPIPKGTIFGDMFYWIRLANQGRVGCVSAPLAHYIAYRPGGDNISAKANVIAWATEVRMLVEQMLAQYWQATDNPEAVACLRYDAADFVARSTADQFVWNALRGAPRLELLRAIAPALSFVLPGRGAFRLFLRIIAALFVGRNFLQRKIQNAAARKAEQVVAQNSSFATPPNGITQAEATSLD